MLKKPWCLVLLALLTTVGGIFTYKYFSLAFPLVSLDLRMDRQSALVEAAKLAKKLKLGPSDYRAVASFSLDGYTRNFVELEGGGREAFVLMLKQDLYSPYRWRVRHFQEKNTNEVYFYFTPQGAPYGFSEKIAENETGPALTPEAARQLAEKAAREFWGINLAAYKLIEQSKHAQTNGRLDHAFTYERPEPLGEARYRLRLEVNGKKVTEVSHFLKVPEGFGRRFAERRSGNRAIATAGSLAMFIFYILGGCIVGMLFLLKRRALLWKPALCLAAFIGLLVALTEINELL